MFFPGFLAVDVMRAVWVRGIPRLYERDCGGLRLQSTTRRSLRA